MPKLEIDQYLTGEDVGAEKTFIFVAPHAEEIIELGEGKESKKVQTIKVDSPETGVKSWTMNKTSMIAIATSYGKNTDDWVGKSVVLFTVDANVKGIQRKVIYARVPVVPKPASAPPVPLGAL